MAYFPPATKSIRMADESCDLQRPQHITETFYKRNLPVNAERAAFFFYTRASGGFRSQKQNGDLCSGVLKKWPASSSMLALRRIKPIFHLESTDKMILYITHSHPYLEDTKLLTHCRGRYRVMNTRPDAPLSKQKQTFLDQVATHFANGYQVAILSSNPDGALDVDELATWQFRQAREEWYRHANDLPLKRWFNGEGPSKRPAIIAETFSRSKTSSSSTVKARRMSNDDDNIELSLVSDNNLKHFAPEAPSIHRQGKLESLFRHINHIDRIIYKHKRSNARRGKRPERCPTATTFTNSSQESKNIWRLSYFRWLKTAKEENQASSGTKIPLDDAASEDMAASGNLEKRSGVELPSPFPVKEAQLVLCKIGTTSEPGQYITLATQSIVEVKYPPQFIAADDGVGHMLHCRTDSGISGASASIK